MNTVSLNKTPTMKQVCLILALSGLLIACNNNEKSDAVEKADSINRAKRDSDLSDPTVNTPPIIKTDQESTLFLVSATNSGIAEVKLGEMGQQKATNAEVKNFAAMMVREHATANEEIKKLSALRNVTLPTTHGDEKQKILDDLSKRSGADFDRRFMRIMVMEHETAIGVFQNASDVVNDVDVKNFIDSAIPKLRNHLDSAKAISKLVQ
jgi:putative membrane protein